jgi:hypothetical protein
LSWEVVLSNYCAVCISQSISGIGTACGARVATLAGR